MRWKQCLTPLFSEIGYFDPDKFGNPYKQRGFRTLSRLYATRKAVNAALRAGYKDFLLSTNGETAMLPDLPGVRYFIYGDAGQTQFRKLYLNCDGNWKSRLQLDAMRRVAERGHSFLGMSRWAIQGMRSDYGLKPEQIFYLPPPVDTDFFTPQDRSSRNGRLKILFLGGDFWRKGGDVVMDVARDPEFSGFEWHFITRDSQEQNGTVWFHSGVTPQSPKLLGIMAQCDLLVLPTRADCSSLAALEALSCEIPVIINLTGGTGDIVTTCFNGFLLDEPGPSAVKQALRRYIEEPELLSVHGKNGRRRVLQENSLPVHGRTVREVISGTATPYDECHSAIEIPEPAAIA